MAKRLNIAVLLSGSGTTLANLLEWQKDGRLMADIGLVVASSPKAGGLEIAAKSNVRTEVVDARKYAISAREGEEIRDYYAMSEKLNRIILGGGFDLVCMAGFLCRYIFDDSLVGKVLNIHPSLIPMFCGQGMYGARVHKAVVEAGVRVTGCTVHLADHHYDTGPIVLQRCCPVYGDDAPEDVQRRVFREECVAYPTAVNLFAEGKVRYDGGRRTFISDDWGIGRFGGYDD